MGSNQSSSVVAQRDTFTTQIPPVFMEDGGCLSGVPQHERHKLDDFGKDPEGKLHNKDNEPNDTTADTARDGEKPKKGIRPPNRIRRREPENKGTHPSMHARGKRKRVLGALVGGVRGVARAAFHKLTVRDVAKKQPLFFHDQVRQAGVRKLREQAWHRNRSVGRPGADDAATDAATESEHLPTVGGPDPILCDAEYYARRCKVPDGAAESQKGPNLSRSGRNQLRVDKGAKYAVLLIHGLLQSSGAYCCDDNQPLASWLRKSGFDVWLGNNRCGFRPRHASLKHGDPRMWAD
ncbi:hypothetical protein RJ55_03379 [Drechmeria coniospora]|nr:hypothetical protein RJ55_03379 [Drechmeria coniospora]